ncbi:MAG: TatD family hydrolase [Gammaproteobacteria bacterium]|nr:TatD family hydrolase [Gammaproteobacteria bacterium]
MSGAITGLIDVGANLAHASFDTDRDAALERARRAGVGAMIITGSDAASNERALMLARTHPGRLYATAGLHPHHASQWNAALGRRIAELAGEPEVVALGECGLDYFRDLSPRPAQRDTFAAQLELAASLGKPLFLHQRDAHEDFGAILRQHRARLATVVVHCFTDTRDALADYLALDCHIGITGWICDERRGLSLRDSVRLIPDQRLLLETDAPFLLPRTVQPKPDSRRNEPAYLPWVLQAVALARGQAPEHVAAITAANARHCFGLDRLY